MMKVLVPDALGLIALAGASGVEAVRYDPGAPFGAALADAGIIVVGFAKAADVGARLGDLPALRLVQTLNAGYDQWVPVLPAGVMLSNARGVHGGSSAEWVVGALLSIYRDFGRFAAQQQRHEWAGSTTETLLDSRVVVLGAGDLGHNLRARLEPFGATVTLVGRRARPGVRTLTDIDDELRSADALVALLPLSDHTRHLVDGPLLARLPDNAVVVNAGRGGLVDTDALLRELTSGRLRAALDVTDPEPLPAEHPLWSAPGLLLTPHVAGNVAGWHERAWEVARAQIEQFIAGGRPANLVAGPGADDAR